MLDRGFDVSPDPTDPANWYHLLETQRDANALYQTQFEVCKKVQGDSLRYMGTTSVVRDIDFIATALQGDDSLMWGRLHCSLTGSANGDLCLVTSMGGRMVLSWANIW